MKRHRERTRHIRSVQVYFGTKEDVHVTCRFDADEIGKLHLQIRPTLI